MNWIAIVVLLVIVVVVGLLREHRRVSGLEKWAQAKGFSRRFPVPPEGPQPAAGLVSQLAIHGARRWGLVFDGNVDGVPVTIAEHESSMLSRKTGVWHTIVTWPAEGASGRIVLQHGSGPEWLADAAAVVVGPVKAAVAEVEGLPSDDTTPRFETPGGWVVLGEPIERDRWLTPEKMRDLDAWPHGGAFVCDQASAGWRREGTITADTVATLPEQLAAARRLLQ